jgi:hypothetical protein
MSKRAHREVFPRVRGRSLGIAVSLGGGRVRRSPRPRENAEHGNLLVNLLAEDHSQADKDGRHRLVIEAYGYRWYRVGGLDYLLRRGAALVLRAGLFDQHRRQLVLAGRLSSVRRHRRRQKGY